VLPLEECAVGARIGGRRRPALALVIGLGTRGHAGAGIPRGGAPWTPPRLSRVDYVFPTDDHFYNASVVVVVVVVVVPLIALSLDAFIRACSRATADTDVTTIDTVDTTTTTATATA